MRLVSLILTIETVRFSWGCTAVVPSTTPSPTSTPSTTTTTTPCNCMFMLYDATLCNAGATCPNTGKEFTYDVVGTKCVAQLHCPVGSTVNVRYASGISIRDMTMMLFLENYMIECRGGKWLVTDKMNPLPQEVTGIVCNVKARREAEKKSKRDTPEYISESSALVEHNEDPTSEDSAPTCSICSPSATHTVEDYRCPDNFHCTEARIERKFNASSGCQHLTVACPGTEMQVLLEAGKSKTICPESVRCDGEWTLIEDDNTAQRIVNMMCLNRPIASHLKLSCSCRKPLPLRLCTETRCQETVADLSPDGCMAEFPCDKGFRLEIARKGKDGKMEISENFTIESQPPLTCMNGLWILETKKKAFVLKQDEILSCRTPAPPKFQVSPKHEI